MKKTTKVWLAVAAILVVIGCVLFSCAMTSIGWDFKRLSTVNYEMNIYEISQEFADISIHTDTADVVFAVSDDGQCKVMCYEDDSRSHYVAVENNTLVIRECERGSWLEYMEINFGTAQLTVYLPQAQYGLLLIRESTGNISVPQDFTFQNVDILLSTGDVEFSASVANAAKIKTSTGDITVSNVMCQGDFTIDATTGDVNMTDITCNNMTSTGTTGNVYMENIIVSEKLTVKRSTGDVEWKRCDSAEILIQTNTGDVTGNFLTDKTIITNTSTGSVNVPKEGSGGKCDVSTSTGDIHITVG